MLKSIDVGAGYRVLEPEEIIQSGDEFFEPTARSRWIETQQIGDRVREGASTIYRRKISPPIVNAGNVFDSASGEMRFVVMPGYRLLQPDEILNEGDEYFSDGLWRKTEHAGKKKIPMFSYRRQITCEEITLQPRNLWLEHRHADVCRAIRRNVDSGIPVPAEWMREYFSYLETRTKIE